MPEYIRHRPNSTSPNTAEDNEGFFCRFTFGQFFALLVLEVFTIFFVFYLGARYGPEFLGFEKKGPLVVGDAEQKGTSKVTTTTSPEVAAMAKDLVEKAKTPALKERLAEMLKRAPEGRTIPPADVGRVETAPSTAQAPTVQPLSNVQNPNAQIPGGQNLAAQNVQNPPPQDLPLPAETEEPPVTAPAEQAAKAPKSGSMPMRQAQPPAEVEKGAIRIKSAENAKYSLQIGSYQQMTEANGAVERWKGKGYSAFLMIADIPDRGRWYRVRLGGFASKDEAQKYKKEFESQEATQAIVVMNEQ